YRRWVLSAITALVLAAVCIVAGARVASVANGPVAELAEQHAVAHLRLQVDNDPRKVEGGGTPLVVFDAEITRVQARGTSAQVSAPVVVWAERAAARFRLGDTVTATAVLEPSDDTEHTAQLDVHRARLTGDPRAWWWDAAGAMRRSVTAAVAR